MLCSRSSQPEAGEEGWVPGASGEQQPRLGGQADGRRAGGLIGQGRG